MSESEGPEWTPEQEHAFNAIAATNPALRRAIADYSDGDADAVNRFLADPANAKTWALLRERLPPPDNTR